MDHIVRLQELIQRLQKLRIDNIEYAYLRALVLFSTGERRFGSGEIPDALLPNQISN